MTDLATRVAQARELIAAQVAWIDSYEFGEEKGRGLLLIVDGELAHHLGQYAGWLESECPGPADDHAARIQHILAQLASLPGFDALRESGDAS